MSRSRLLFHSRRLPGRGSGRLLDVSPRRAGWQSIHFSVRRLVEGEQWTGVTRDTEACLVLLSGLLRIEWSSAIYVLGPRASVFHAYPHAVYLPPGMRFRVTAEETSELAEGRAPSRRPLAPYIIRPDDCGYEIRGGGNATRQIVDIMRPDFPADRLMVCEVFTPGGNWSSYPPHKHDTDSPPQEVDLDEIYYYRFRGPGAYGYQRVYTSASDEILKVEDGDLVVIREGYHPFVTAFGCDAYYLNVLAGARRSMAASDDPRYAAVRRQWPPPDPRLPLVPPPAGISSDVG